MNTSKLLGVILAAILLGWTSGLVSGYLLHDITGDEVRQALSVSPSAITPAIGNYVDYYSDGEYEIQSPVEFDNYTYPTEPVHMEDNFDKNVIYPA